MAYVSPGAAAADGIESGVNLGIKVQRARRDEEEYTQRKKEHAEDRGHLMSERERLGRVNARAEAQGVEDRDYTTAKRELEAVDLERNQLNAQLKVLAQKTGKFDPADPQQAALGARIDQVNDQRRQAVQRLYKPITERYEKEARDIVEGLQNGRVDIGSLTPAQAYRAFAGVLRRDPRDALRGPNGEPSKLGGAIKRITQGFETGDQQSIVDGAGVILEPELRVGVGQQNSDGSVITGKKLDRFVPAPGGKGFMPNLSVEVENLDGSKVRRYAPVTEDRSSNSKSRVVSLDPDKIMERLGRMGILEDMLNLPQLRALIEQGAKEVGPEAQDFFAGLAELGAVPGKFTTKDTRLGDKVERQTYNEAGQPVGKPEVKELGVDPNTRERVRAGGIRSAGTAQGVRHDRVLVPTGEEDESGNPIMEERFVQLPTRAGGPAPKVVDLPGGAKPAPRGGPKEEKPEEVRKAADNEVARAAADMNLSWDDASKRWKAADGKPASQDQVARLNAVRAEALNRGKKSKGAADSVSKPKMPDAEVTALRDKAKKAIADGKDKAAVAKRFEDLTGLKY